MDLKLALMGHSSLDWILFLHIEVLVASSIVANTSCVIDLCDKTEQAVEFGSDEIST